MEFSHLDDRGRAQMVDVTAKSISDREARARTRIIMLPQTGRRIREGAMGKGEVLAVARIAGIMAAKQTAQLIPLCHPLPVGSVTVEFRWQSGTGAASPQATDNQDILEIESRVRTCAATGVEMEALTAAAITALTVYDMCKAVDKSMVITDLRLVEKRGGKSGHFHREDESDWVD